MISCILSGLFYVGIVFMVAGLGLKLSSRSRTLHAPSIRLGAYVYLTGVLACLPFIFIQSILLGMLMVISAGASLQYMLTSNEQ